MVVAGDVNSKMAAEKDCVKLGVSVAHVEAGFRSHDRSMPEEINRILTDTVSDMLFLSEPRGVDDLLKEGHSASQIHLAGNVMTDTLMRLLPSAKSCWTVRRFGLEPAGFGVVTLHRPSNVDERKTFAQLFVVLLNASKDLPFVFVEDCGLRVCQSELPEKTQWVQQ